MKNKIIVLWAILVIGLLCVVLIIGKYQLANKEYFDLTKLLKESTKEYLEDFNLYPDNGKSIVVESDTLIEKEYINELKLKDKLCNATITVTKKIIYNYNFKFVCE